MSGTWVYFLSGLEPGGQESFEVREVVPIRGKSSVTIQPKTVLTRLESPTPLESFQHEMKFKGTVRHLQYTPSAVRAELQNKSAAPYPASSSTLAVLIPIRKTEQWWGLSQDDRQKYFEQSHRHKNHTAIGMDYAARIYRKLYHSRYLEANPPLDYDFLTYFEFEEKDTPLFKSLLADLRDTEKNPEWKFVDFEMEIWMKKSGGAA